MKSTSLVAIPEIVDRMQVQYFVASDDVANVWVTQKTLECELRFHIWKYSTLLLFRFPSNNLDWFVNCRSHTVES